MNTISSYLLLIFSFLSIYPLSAQEITFGKVSSELLKEEYYEQDSSASAAILYEYGKSNFRHLENYGFRVETERTVRIKIYRQAGSEWGNVSIPLYRDGFNRTETYRDVKGYSYNLVNGIIEKKELEKQDIFEEEVSEKWRKIKFALPNVQAGTVIEYTYTVISPFLFKLEDWQFQYDIPVKWSEYQLTVPAFYEYMILKQGYFDLEKQEAKSLRDQQKLGSYTYDNVRYEWAMKNIPAYQEEMYMTTREDYIAKIIFQLSKVNYPGRHVKDYMTNWPTLVKDLMDMTDFGKNIKKNDTRDLVKDLTVDLQSENDKAQTIYDHVVHNFAWNQKNSFSPSLTTHQLLKEKTGNCTDINLLLLNMLLKADIKAEPVLLSTRNHGKISTSFPLIDQFNYTIVYAQVEGKGILLDATSPELPFGMLNEECLNGYGLIADEKSEEERWIDVSQMGVYFADILVQLSYDKELEGIKAMVKENYRDYAALRARRLYQEKGEEHFSGKGVKSLQVENENAMSQPFVLRYETQYTAEDFGNIVSIPAFEIVVEEHPFKEKERYYPVNFGMRKAVKYKLIFNIPEGYTLEEWPQDMHLKLSDSSVSFSTKSQYTLNTLQLVSFFQINKLTIGVEQYQELRQLYSDILNKQMEKIILKKADTE